MNSEPSLTSSRQTSLGRTADTALVGESGSGKSTVAALLQRLYPIDAGRICIGGRDLAHTELASLRRAVGVVPQTIDLFDGSILDNLAIGDAEPDVRRLTQLCDSLDMLRVIERMPHGWLSPVGERGVALSGGERQRLAIVRVLYRRPSVLILDEATSALDFENERRVLKLVRDEAERGVAVVMIAHRLSSVQTADHIVMLRAGQVIEQGDHGTLMRRSEEYGRLWALQHGAPTPSLAQAV